MKKLSTLDPKTILILIVLIIISSALVYLFFKSHYKLRPDIFNYKTYLVAAIIFIPLVIIDEKRKENNENHTRWITFIILIIIATPKILGILMIKYSDIPFTTTNAFVKYEYTHKGRSFYRLQFNNNQMISSKEFDITRKIYAKDYDCLKVKYRENALVIEVRPIENLGDMTKEQCLNQQ